MHVCDDVLPRHDDQNVEIEPPDQQKREIQSSNARGRFVARNVGSQGQRAHNRNQVQEKHHIPSAKVGYIAPKNNFVVGPKELVRQPKRNAESDQRPEKPHAPLRP